MGVNEAGFRTRSAQEHYTPTSVQPSRWQNTTSGIQDFVAAYRGGGRSRFARDSLTPHSPCGDNNRTAGDSGNCPDACNADGNSSE